MLWYGQNATERTCVFGVNRPYGGSHSLSKRGSPHLGLGSRALGQVMTQ